jgi:hypothetical protein
MEKYRLSTMYVLRVCNYWVMFLFFTTVMLSVGTMAIGLAFMLLGDEFSASLPLMILKVAGPGLVVCYILRFILNPALLKRIPDMDSRGRGERSHAGEEISPS